MSIANPSDQGFVMSDDISPAGACVIAYVISVGVSRGDAQTCPRGGREGHNVRDVHDGAADGIRGPLEPGLADDERETTPQRKVSAHVDSLRCASRRRP